LKRRLAALVYGNAKYSGITPLKNPVNDANDLAAKLKSYGFDVILSSDATALQMDKKLREFNVLLQKNDVGLFFFAGHGVQIEGVNYLIATDTDTTSEVDAKHSSLSLDKVIDTMSKSDVSTKIIVLDACRNNPWERAWHRGTEMRGLASVYAPKGTIIGFATSPGELAGDGTGRNGTYTAALLQHIDTVDCSIETMFKRVRNTVAAVTNGKQTSWEHTSLSGEFYFNLGLGKLISTYKDTSLADSLLVLDEGRTSHQIIAALKTHNWYLQNPGLALLNDASVDKMSIHNLFVIGRNIYQAACGSANAAQNFIANFISATSGFEEDKRKAVLDGMLFEIFFDSKAELRSKIKGRYFDEVFALQRHTSLKKSFAFIAEALSAANADFYSLPGKGHELAVTIATKKVDDEYRVEGVFIDGKNVLRRIDGDDDWDIDTGIKYRRLMRGHFEQLLSEQLVLPARQLKLTYTPTTPDDFDEVGFPFNWTVQKQKP